MYKVPPAKGGGVILLCHLLFLPISCHAPPLGRGGHVCIGQGGGLPGGPHRSRASRCPVCPRGFNVSLRPSLAGSASLQRPPQAETGNAGKERHEPASRGTRVASVCVSRSVSLCMCSSEKDFKASSPSTEI